MVNIRRAADRGHARLDWLNSFHTFSFGEYHDPQHMGISNLRVINDDFIAPCRGFGMHGHDNMEIVTYVLEGALQHRDSMGNGSIIRPGDVQRMSAGTGVRHSEVNASEREPVHLLQIWLLPNARDVAPGYAQQHFSAEERRGRLALLLSPDGRDGSISAHEDALIYAALLERDQAVEHRIAAGRQAYVHVALGGVEVNGQTLQGGDGVHLSAEARVRVAGLGPAEVLVFDLP
jgi:hypothetical protein